MDEVAEIKQKLDIVDIIGTYIQLKPAGRNLKAFSPFHTEKTPSFMVSPDKGIWHDFSTDEGGDIFTFVMRMEGVSFLEALEILAKRAGVTLKPRGAGQRGPAKTPLYEIMELAVKYYHLSLSRNKAALSYLREERSLSAQVIKDFALGYAPQSWDALTSFLRKKGYTNEQLVQAGVAAQKQGKSSAYDLFRARILFPIFDTQGRPVGFSGRVLPGDDGGAKYINTPQTAIYNKSSAIYGLMQAKEAIRTHDEVVIVEGNMDVVALRGAGFEQVVACSGTALTSEQLKVLSRLTKNIKICFDQDVAGVKAAQRAIELAQGSEIKLEVITFDGAKDPDELITKDKQLWIRAVEEARYAVDYLFDYAKQSFGTSSASAKKQMSSFLSATIRKLEDTVEQDHYIKRLSEELSVSEDSIRRKLDSAEVAEVAPLKAVEQSPQSTVRTMTKQERTEQGLLKLMFAYPAARMAVGDIVLKHISEANRPFFVILQKYPKSKLETLAKYLHERENDVKILALKGEEEYSGLTEHDIGLEAYTQVHRLQKLNRELNKRRLAKQIAEAEAAGDRVGVKRLLTDYQALLNEE